MKTYKLESAAYIYVGRKGWIVERQAADGTWLIVKFQERAELKKGDMLRVRGEVPVMYYDGFAALGYFTVVAEEPDPPAPEPTKQEVVDKVAIPID